jgi:acetyltransferase-like isoleucine patch superfamily enzyme
MKKANNDFIREYLCRGGGSSDNNYLFLAECDSTDPIYRADVLYSGLIDFLYNNVKLSRDGIRYLPPENITFDFKLGWILESAGNKSFLGKLSVEQEMTLQVGHGSYFSGEVNLHGSGTLRIGNFCGIAAGTHFYTSEDKHPLGYISHFNFHDRVRLPRIGLDQINPSYDGFEPVENLTIENNVWVGRDVTIKQGLTIGNGAVIAEKSYVNKSIEPYSLNGGLPARLIRKLCDETLINTLEELAWWHWTDEKILRNRKLFEHPMVEIHEELVEHLAAQ